MAAWKVAVTTASGRERCTLRATLDSIYEAGWAEVVLSGDGEDPPDLPGLRVEARRRCSGPKRLGPWPHWLDVVRHALRSCDDWDSLLVVQDDVRLARNLRWWLDSRLCEWRRPTTGVASLWLPGCYPRDNELCRQHRDVHPDQVEFWPLPTGDLPRKAYGALALVLHRHVALAVTSWAGHNGSSKADYWLGKFCKERGWNWLYPSRSLAQHTGEGDSTLDTGDRSPLYRLATNPVTDCWGFP
jgi:hypothetical protein